MTEQHHHGNSRRLSSVCGGGGTPSSPSILRTIFLSILTITTTLIPTISAQVTFSTCDQTPIPVYDFGTLLITSKYMNIAFGQGYTAPNYTYQVLQSNDGVISASFSHTDLLANTVSFSPNVPLQSTIATKSSVIQFLASDPTGKTAQCNLNLEIRFGFAPQLDVTASFAIVTFTNTPVVVDKNIVSLNEAHGLSMWNMNWTSVDTTFNRGTQGRLEYFTVASGWIPFPITQPFPHAWIDNAAIRYNPVNFVGRATLSLQLSGRSATGLLPIAGEPFIVNVTITSSQGTAVTIQPTAAPPFSQLRCPIVTPDPFPFSYKAPFGPFCGSFQTTPNTDVTWNAPFLGIRLVANTKAAANITFGTGVRLAPNQFPPDLNRTLQFAGLIDYGAFYIHVTPPTVGINSFTLTTPELSYEQSMSIVSPSQITGWLVDTSTLFYVTSIQSPVPRLRTILYTPGTFVFLAGASGSNAGNSNFGVNSFLGSWGVKTYTFGGSTYGSLTVTLRAATDMTFTLVEGGQNTWSPGGITRLAHYTLTTTATTPYNFTLSFNWKKDALMLANIGQSSLKWGLFQSSIDGGNWNLTNSAILDPSTSTITTNVITLGQWAVFGSPGSTASKTMSGTFIAMTVAFMALTISL